MPSAARLRLGALLVVLAIGLPAPAATQADETSGSARLVTSASIDEIAGFVTEAGYVVAQQQAGMLLLRSPSGEPFVVVLQDCAGDRCTWLRTRSFWPLGQREAAIAAAHAFDRERPAAIVALLVSDGETTAAVGRDVYLGSGVTTFNMVANIVQTELLAMGFREALTAADSDYDSFYRSQGHAQ